MDFDDIGEAALQGLGNLGDQCVLIICALAFVALCFI